MPLPIQIVEGREPAVTSTRTPGVVIEALDIQYLHSGAMSIGPWGIDTIAE